MSAVHNQHGLALSSAGRVNALSRVLRALHHALDGRGLRTDGSHNPIRVRHISKAYVNKPSHCL